MTVRELKNMLMEITDDEALDQEIRYCFEDIDSGLVCEAAWFDIQDWGYSCYPTITLCDTIESYNKHEGRSPWTQLPEYLKEEF